MQYPKYETVVYLSFVFITNNNTNCCGELDGENNARFL